MSKYTKVKNYTDRQLLERAKKTEGFKAIPLGYWILGVRAKEANSAYYSDKFYLFKGEKFILVTTGTTNPGRDILRDGWKSINDKGAFVLKSDFWHNSIWIPGKHRGRMDALVQQGGEVVGYRDKNNNTTPEECGEEVRGYFGINFHLNSYNTLSNTVNWLVGGWSAGCQVSNAPEKYREIINLTKNQKRISYCLLKEF